MEDDSNVQLPLIASSLREVNSVVFQDEDVSVLQSINLLFVSALISSIGILPYLVYPRQLLLGDWILFCIVRPMLYFLVFSAAWHKLLTRKNLYWGTWRIFVNIVFSAIYSGLYAVKWTETEGIYIRYLAIPCFSLSWFIVFYEVMDRYLSSNRVTGSATSIRQQKILLFMIQQQERERDKTYRYEALMRDKTVSLLVTKWMNLAPSSAEETKLDVYESIAFDPWKSRISSLVSLIMGFTIVPLTLALIEDYGYSLYKLIANTDAFLWLVFILCVMLAFLYLLATYPMYQKMLMIMVKLTQEPKDVLLGRCKRIYLFILAATASVSRANSSYSMFGSIIGRMSVPTNIGLFLVWFSVLVVALVDYSAMLQILSRSVKYVWNTLMLSGISFQFTREWTETSFVRHYSKRLKRFVRNADEDQLRHLSDRLL